jgi:saccharopine dehydrogenase (NAD+, L-lysine-forming)
MSLFHPDGYELTAIPVVASILQWLDGSARKPGLFWQALFVDPERFITDINRMGVCVEERWETNVLQVQGSPD